jgi:rRNA maturation RNase YbeY
VSARGQGKSPPRRAARLRIDVAREGTRGGLSGGAARRAAELAIGTARARVSALSITFVSDAIMRRLNRRHLGRSGLTDVIAFSLTHAGMVNGDIYIAPSAARLSAAAHRVPVREELTRLVVHGVLHVLGWDHPEGDRRTRSTMWRRQESLVRKLRGAS